jgi:hypothetical protein
MSSTIVIGIAVLGNCAVAAATYAVRGWAAAGGHAAARNTARFSLAWFVVAFAAPGIVRFIRKLPSDATLVRSFVGAHVVHFAAVLGLLLGFESAHLRQHPGQAVAVIGIGFSIVALLGLTAPSTARVCVTINRITLYLVFLIFFAAFVAHPIKPLRAISFVLGAALILRLLSGTTFYQSRAAAPNSRSAAQS